MRKLFSILLILTTAITFAQNRTLTATDIISESIARKVENDPREVFRNYTFQSYEKTIITDTLNGSTHNFFSEKVSTLHYTNEDQFSEKVIGYQLAGFKKPRYEIFAVNVQSRSFYDNDFVIFNNRYAGVLSNRGLKNHNYQLIENTDNGDYVISFSPKKPKKVPGLTGEMILDKKTLALKNINLHIQDGINIKLNQEYTYLQDHQVYVPSTRELFIDKGEADRRLSFFGGKISIGTIESEVLEDMVTEKFLVSTTKTSHYIVNQTSTEDTSNYTITFEPGADSRNEEFWKEYRTTSLSNKDVRSFSELEKIVASEKIERSLGTINNFSLGYFSVKAFDFDLTYPVKLNNFEGLRLGLGGVTNETFSKRFRLEGYGAYGFRDKKFKYGLGGGYLINPDKGMWISGTFNRDIEEVGNFAYLTDRRTYSFFEPRLVNITQFYRHSTARINLEYRVTPRILSEFQIAHRQLSQTFDYRFNNDGTIISDYNITEATAGFRWSPSNTYLKTDNSTVPVYEGYPIISGQISQAIDGLGGDLAFTRIGANALFRIDQLNKSSTEFLVEGNIGFGDLPLTHLFHAYPNAPTKETILQRFSVAGVNSFETMFFGEFYSDRLFTAQVKHRLRPFDFGKYFKPEVVFISRFAIGDISNPQDHLDITFDSLDKGYTESGFEINRLFYAFGTSLTYRYGAYHLPSFEDNIAFKFTYKQRL